MQRDAGLLCMCTCVAKTPAGTARVQQGTEGHSATEQSKIVHTNLNVLIEELRSFGIDSQETGYVPDITPLE